tara:strand:- start:8140 stop:8376 length:237 start_codon:yes stop_codon:yes gene_type:complete
MFNSSPQLSGAIRTFLVAIAAVISLPSGASAGQISLDYQPQLGDLAQVKSALQEIGKMLEQQHQVKSQWGNLCHHGHS